MKSLIPMNEHGVFADRNDVVRVDSRFVAEAFDKNHRDVLRGIRKLVDEDSGLSADFRLRNFAQSTYINERGHRQPCYEMTRDGFSMLVMGFTGKKAARFKELYIKRFDEMEKLILTLQNARHDFPKLTEHIRLLKPEASPHDYSNECDMLNRIVLGMSAKQYREAHGIEKGKSIRPYLREDQVSLLSQLQNVDMGLLLSTPDYHQRKRYLEWYAMKHS